MKSNYKKLGPYIRQIDDRNTEDIHYELLGVSVDKCFIKSIANTVGTNWRGYKKIRRGQFCYIPDTSRRGDKIGIALQCDYDIALVSQAYTVFEISDIDTLLPEYLNLWFKRPEFDRYARFHSHGSVREIFDWEEMCNVELPIPKIDEQRRIVNAYNTIERCIELKRKINENLEKQALAILMDYTFNAAKNKLSAVILDSCTGGDAIQKVPIVSYDTGVKCARVGDITNNRQSLMWSFCNAERSTIKTYRLHKYNILVTRTATLGAVQLIMDNKDVLVFNNGLIRLIVDSNKAFEIFIYWTLKNIDFYNYIHQIDFATSVRPNMKKEYLLNYDMPMIDMDKQKLFVAAVEPLTFTIYNNTCKINTLQELKTIILLNLSR